LNTVSSEIQKTDSRIIQKLLDLLFSHNFLTHFPAHAVVQATPVPSKVKVSDSHQFSFRKRIESSSGRGGKPEERNIHFTPSGEFKLFKGQVRFLAGGDQLYQFSGQVKESLDLSGAYMVPDFAKLHIGIELDKQIEDMAGLSLHFSMKNISGEDRFYQSLPSADWFINGKGVSFSQGLNALANRGLNGLEELFQQENDISYRASKYVNDYYGHQFMILEGDQLNPDLFRSNTTIPDNSWRPLLDQD